MNNKDDFEDIEDGVFEEVRDREVLSIKDLSPELADKLRHDIEEAGSNELSAEDAAAFAAELEAARSDVVAIQTPDKEDRPLTQAEMISAVNNAVRDGVLSKGRKERMLRDMGIFKSTFTKKSVPKSSKNKKRKAAKKARRKNRK